MAEDMRRGFHSVGGTREICGLDSQEQSRSDKMHNEVSPLLGFATSTQTGTQTRLPL